MKRWRVGIPLSIFLFFACLAAQAQCACTDCRCSDSLELVKLYNSTGGDNWTNKTNWKVAGKSIDTWYGIALTNGRVTGIDLDGIADFSGNDFTAIGNNLRGILPSMSLSALTFLDLDTNKGLKGDLPAMTLPEITLIGLGGDSLTGTIPSSWNFPKLQYLALCCNQLNGILPTLNFPQLVGLYLQNNKLKGALPTINAPLLGDIRMSANQFTGCFPTSYSRFCPFTFAWFDNNAGLPNNGDFTAFCRNSTGMCTVIDTSSCRYKDSTALAALYRATNMQNVPPQYKWDLSQPMTTWYGVTLNANGCVACVDLDGGAIDCGNLDPNPSGIGLVGTLPDSMRLLTSLQRLVLQGNTGLGGVLPTNFGNMTGLKQFYAYNCRFTPPFPASFWTLPNIESIDLNDNLLNIPFPSEFGNFKKLKDLHLCTTGLTGSIPTSLGLLDSLGNVDICDNNLTGAVPINLTTRTKMQVFQVESNKLDVLPKFDATRFQRYEPRFIPFFSVQNNRFTFDDIVPNMPIINRISATYAKQDSIFQTITYTKNVGETLTIDLGIDASLNSNKYVWIKNGVRFDSSNQNTFILRGVTSCDAGTYRCEVTNANAPLLTLKSRIITLIINPSNPQIRNKTICYGQKDTLPSGQIVAPTASAIYRETLRNSMNTCDSAIITTNLTVIPIPVISKIDSFCQGKTYTLTQRATNNVVMLSGIYDDTLTATNGCKTRYTTTLTYRSNLTRTERISLCTGEKYILPNGNVVNTEGSYISRKTTSGCDSVITTIVSLHQKVKAVDDAVEVLKNIKDVLINVLANDIYPANLYDIKLLQNPNIGKVEELNNDKFKLTIPSSATTDIIFTYQLCHLNCVNDCTIGTVRVKILDKGTELDPIITGISPNGDGKNDRLDFPQIDWRKYTKSTLEIYNRWGQKLYASAPYQRDWDGQNTDGVLLPEGDYFFILRLIGSDGKIIAGSVYLSR